MKILIANTHSTLNSGDAAIVISQTQFLKNYFHDVTISITSRTPKLDKVFYKSLGIKVFPPLFPAPSVFTNSARKVTQTLKNLTDIGEKNALIKEMKRSDLVIGSGGGYFWTHRRYIPGPMFFQNYFHLKLAAQMKKPIILFPQSFGHLRNKMAAKLLKELLEKEQILGIFAREKISLDFLNEFLVKNKKRVHYCPDMAFALIREHETPDSLGRFDLPRPIIALTLRQWDFPKAKNRHERKTKKAEYLMSFQKLSKKIVNDWNGSIVIFCQSRGPGNFENDRLISNKLFENLKETLPENHLHYINLEDNANPMKIVNILKKTDLLIATRFHSGIFALIAGVPVISISYQPKSMGIMETLNLERFCLDISEFNAADIFHLCEEILNDSDKIKNNIQKNISNFRHRIKVQLKSSLQDNLFIQK